MLHKIKKKIADFGERIENHSTKILIILFTMWIVVSGSLIMYTDYKDHEYDDNQVEHIYKFYFDFYNSVSYEQITEGISIELYSYKFDISTCNTPICIDKLDFPDFTYTLEVILFNIISPYRYNTSLNYVCRINKTGYYSEWKTLKFEVNHIALHKQITNVSINLKSENELQFNINDSDSCLPELFELRQDLHIRPYLTFNFTNNALSNDFEINYNLIEGYCIHQNLVIFALNTISPGDLIWFDTFDSNPLQNILLSYGSENNIIAECEVY